MNDEVDSIFCLRILTIEHGEMELRMKKTMPDEFQPSQSGIDTYWYFVWRI